MYRRVFLLVCSLSAGLLLAGCAPSLSPLYRDFETTTIAPPLPARIGAALEAAGWQTRAGDAPNVVATETRRLGNWGLYAVEVYLEAVPVGSDHVRLYFHPYRHFFTGGRSKIPYLNGRLRRALLADLDAAFADEGLLLIGTSVERDREATDG